MEEKKSWVSKVFGVVYETTVKYVYVFVRPLAVTNHYQLPTDQY